MSEGSFSLPNPQKSAHERSRRRCGRSTTCEFAVSQVVTSDFALLAYTIGLLVVAAGILFTLYRLFTQVISTVILWMLFGLIFVGCYSYRSELYEVGKWLFPQSTPAHATPHGVTVTANDTLWRTMGRKP